MPQLELLVGMVASGKSHYARRRAKEGAMIISHDELTQMLHGAYRYLPGLKEAYWSMMHRLAICCLRDGLDAIIDRTHLTRDSRKRWVDAVRMYNKHLAHGKPPVAIYAVEFPIHGPMVHADRRALSDSRGRSYTEWLTACRHHAQQAHDEPLDWKAEGFDGQIEVPHFDQPGRPAETLSALPQEPGDTRPGTVPHLRPDVGDS